MKKSIIIILLLLGLSHTYKQNNYFINYFNNLTTIEKEQIKNYTLYYPNTFVVINMLI